MNHAYRKIACVNCGKIIDVPIYCGNRFCPVCSVTRSIRVKRRLDFLVNNQPKIPNYSYFFWTFSLKNCSDLKTGIKKLQDSFRKLRNRQYWKNKVLGGAFVIEIKGTPGNWHPHIHAVVYSLYAKWQTVFELWRKCSGGRGCYVKHIPVSAVTAYLTKYLSKPDVPDSVCLTISEGLKSIRLFAPIGIWHSMNKSYKKTAAPCKQCGGSSWQLYDTLMERFPEIHYKEFDTVKQRVLATAPLGKPTLARRPERTERETNTMHLDSNQ